MFHINILFGYMRYVIMNVTFNKNGWSWVEFDFYA